MIRALGASRAPALLGAVLALFVLLAMLKPAPAARTVDVRAILWDAAQPWMNPAARPPAGGDAPAPEGTAAFDQAHPPVNAWLMPAAVVKHMLVDRQPVGREHPFWAKHFEILDLRAESEYERGHVRYALSAPWERFDESLAHGELSRIERTAILVLYGARYPHARIAREVRSAGFDAVYVLEGGLGGWAEQGFPVDKTAAQLARDGEQQFLAHHEQAMRQPVRQVHPAGDELKVHSITYEEVPRLSAPELKALLDRKEPVDLVFVSDRAIFERKRIPGSRWVPLSKVVEEFRGVPRDRQVVFYCGCCEGESVGMSGWAVDALQQLGFASVKHLGGHTKAWEMAGYALEGIGR